MRPRALVVRSGEKRIPSPGGLPIEIVEKVSHAIVPVAPGEVAFADRIDLAIFTSQISVRRLFEETRLLAWFRDAIRGGQIAAVGPATALALSRKGLAPALVARGSAENVLEKLPARMEGQRVLLPRGEDASEELASGLIHRGAQVAPLLLYRKVLQPPDPQIDRELLERPFAAFCTTSPAAARWLFTGRSPEALEPLRRMPAVALGRFTGRFLASHGVARVEIAPEATLAAALQVLVALAGQEVQGSTSEARGPKGRVDNLEP